MHPGRAAVAALGACACACACTRAPSPEARPGPDGLAAALQATLDTIAAAPDRDRAARDAVAAWRVPQSSWRAQVTDAYREHWRDYAAAFDADAPAIAAQLARAAARSPRTIRAQWQYADDPSLTDAQVRVRWVMPTGQPGVVAWIADQRVDTVFVWDSSEWRALIGADDVIVGAVRALEPDCVPAILAAGPPGHCSSIGWLIADAALRGQRDRLRRGCALAAANQCARGL